MLPFSLMLAREKRSLSQPISLRLFLATPVDFSPFNFHLSSTHCCREIREREQPFRRFGLHTPLQSETANELLSSSLSPASSPNAPQPTPITLHTLKEHQQVPQTPQLQHSSSPLIKQSCHLWISSKLPPSPWERKPLRLPNK